MHRFEIKEEDGYQVLVAKKLSLEDEGEYVCKIGDRETKGRLLVDKGKTCTFLRTSLKSTKCVFLK